MLTTENTDRTEFHIAVPRALRVLSGEKLRQIWYCYTLHAKETHARNHQRRFGVDWTGAHFRLGCARSRTGYSCAPRSARGRGAMESGRTAGSRKAGRL